MFCSAWSVLNPYGCPKWSQQQFIPKTHPFFSGYSLLSSVEDIEFPPFLLVRDWNLCEITWSVFQCVWSNGWSLKLRFYQISPQRSVSENSLVAMDFSGTIGRVINNPVEAQSAALEEAHAWRVSINMQALREESGLGTSLCECLFLFKLLVLFFLVIEKKSAHEHFGKP